MSSLLNHTFAPIMFCLLLLSCHDAKLAPMIGVSPVASGQVAVRSIRSANYPINLAAMELHHKYQPQQFYPVQPQQAGSVGAGPSTTTDLTSLNLVTPLQTSGRQDICSVCKCEQAKNAFLVVRCNFSENPNLSPRFDRKYRLPQNTTTMSIHLGPHTQFLLTEGFFENNSLNSLTIEGTYSEKSQVELGTNGFQGNEGPNPEIILNNVFNVAVRSNAIKAESAKLIVKQANSLLLYEDAFKDSRMRCQFVGIQDLRIEEKAFSAIDAKLHIDNCHMDNIHRFDSSFAEMLFVNSTINTINSGAFDVNNINVLVFERCNIGSIKSKAFTDKLYSKKVTISGATIGFIESDAIFGSGISELIMKRNSIENIFTNAIFVTSINVTIAENNIKHLGQNWLHVKEWSKILVERNKFGDFGRMAVEPSKSGGICRFGGNSITIPLEGSLNLNRLCIITEVSVQLPCRCNREWLDKFTDHDLHSEMYCTIDDKLGVCFNTSTFNSLKYEKEVCDEQKEKLDCVANRNLKRIDGRFFTPEELAQRNQTDYKWHIVVGVSGLLVLGLIIVLVTKICRNRRVSSLHGPDGLKSGLGREHRHEFSPNDIKTIDETMKVVYERNAGIHRKINKLTEKMLRPDLDKDECVRIITKINTLLNKVDNNQNGDFSALNRVLLDHVQPELPTAPPPNTIYNPPSGAESPLHDGFYTSSTIIGVPTEGYDNIEPRQFPCIDERSLGGHDDQILYYQQQPPPHMQVPAQEHIYAEPNCVQQPLLPNEYSSPADRNTDNMYEYSEPITERGFIASPVEQSSTTTAASKGAVPAYAVTPMRQQQQQQPYPHLQESNVLPQYALPMRVQMSKTSQHQTQHPSPSKRNLPDVLHQSPSPNNDPGPSSVSGSQLNKVQQIAQNLQSQPKFHLNQFSVPSHAWNSHLVTMPPVPVYTAPDVTHKHAHPTEAYELDMRGAMALPHDSGSDHSGGSNETVKIDDVIEYADA